MDTYRIRNLLDDSPSFALLRRDRDTVALTVSFLYRHFKERQRVVVDRDELIEHLAWELRQLQDEEGPGQSKPDDLLDSWVDGGILRVTVDGKHYPVSLTPDGERLLGWFEEMTNPGLLSTESRLLTIYNLLDDLVSRSTDNPVDRIEYLRAEQQRLQAEIDEIEETGAIRADTPAQRKGQLQQIEQDARLMLRHFAAIEERFRRLAQGILEEQLKPEVTKGEVLGHVLDAHEALRNTEEGITFYAFREFLNNDERREYMAGLLETVSAPAFTGDEQENTFLRWLVRHLTDAGNRVDASNRRLAQNLRSLLDERVRAESQRVREQITTIKRLLHEQIFAGNVNTKMELLEVAGDRPDLGLHLERPLWTPPDTITISTLPEDAADTWDTEALNSMLNAFFIDTNMLQVQIQEVLRFTPSATLGDILRQYPIDKGVAELLGYATLAARESRHEIDPNKCEVVVVGGHRYRVPLMVFRREIDA